MHKHSVTRWQHDHTFGQDVRKSGEMKTRIVIVITAITMVVEIIAGVYFGSMALLADGLHMGSHALALGIAAFAYYFTRKYANDQSFNFGTGKVNSLAAFASAILLVVIGFAMAWESVSRLLKPVTIEFDQAILVAVIGLIVNGICLLILGTKHHDHEDTHRHDHHSHHHHDHAHDHHHHDHPHDHPHETDELKHDHNLFAAYLHVLTDALTSVLAIVALLAGKYFGWVWLDAAIGLLGAVLVAKWSIGLLFSSANVLLDKQAPQDLHEQIRLAIEIGEDKVTDQHIWSVGPNIYAAEISIVTSTPREPEYYWQLLPQHLGLVHVTVQTHHCVEQSC